MRVWLEIIPHLVEQPQSSFDLEMLTGAHIAAIRSTLHIMASKGLVKAVAPPKKPGVTRQAAKWRWNV